MGGPVNFYTLPLLFCLRGQKPYPGIVAGLDKLEVDRPVKAVSAEIPGPSQIRLRQGPLVTGELHNLPFEASPLLNCIPLIAINLSQNRLARCMAAGLRSSANQSTETKEFDECVICPAQGSQRARWLPKFEFLF
jgi:hypothetical protein